LHFEFIMDLIRCLQKTKQSLSARKQIKIFTKPIDDDADISRLARKIIKRCKHIPPSWLSQVEDVLVEIQERNEDDEETKAEQNTFDETNEIDNHLDEALDLLYGDEDEQVVGSLRVLSLCKDVGTLETIAENHQMISALARIMNDKTSFSADTAFNIGKIFLSMATFDDFHPILAKHKVGSIIMDVANQILGRLDEPLDSQCNGDIAILFVYISILNLLSDDSDVLRKMTKKGIIEFVCGCIVLDLPEHPYESALFMMHRISVYEEAVAYCSQDQCLIVPSLVSKLQRKENSDFTKRVFTVLYNLSFDKGCRCKMIETGLTNILSKMIHSSTYGDTALKVLYQLSTDQHERKELLNSDLEHSLIKALHTCKGSLKNAEKDELVFAIIINVSTYVAWPSTTSRISASRRQLFHSQLTCVLYKVDQ